MDKNILLQLTETVKEIEDLKRRIADAEKKREQYQKLIVSDTVKGTRSDGIYGSIKVTGADRRDATYQEMLLARRQDSMRRLLNKLERQRTEAVEYIENLEDSRLRQIARYKYVDGMNWEAVAKKMGTTADACRMEFKRLSKTGSK
ncbi:hypothetical protein [[Ruminococcus] lactaris]|uniref:hypothetical protein n=1 Tax=[Ruminococcus] lactaris TaxID=46228 RepID=UPI00307966E8